MSDNDSSSSTSDIGMALGGIDVKEIVAQRLAAQNKKSVHMDDLLKATKFTKEEIRQMYRGFKQVSP
jgi:hypothetical protein